MSKFDDKRQQKILNEFRAEEQESLANFKAQKLGMTYADLREVPFERETLSLITEEQAKELQTIPFSKDGRVIRVGSVSPEKEEVKTLLQEIAGEGRELKVFVVSPNSLNKAWPLYEEIRKIEARNVGTLGITDDLLVELVKNEKPISELKSLLEERLKPNQKTSDLVEMIVAIAISADASDIHLEPQEEYVQLRLRLDGVLHPIVNYPFETHKRLLSRLKLMSKLKLNITSEAQDGRFSIRIADKEIEVRSSIIPGAFGESVVMRLLNPDATKINIDVLGMEPELIEVVKREISRPNGLVLTTGPTGSGKSTGMYSFLKHVYQPGIKIITIENPIEYHLEGIVQTQVDEKKGYTFYDGLRSALRQDPDIIMVGEIRDSETATTAIQAALTGHLVFSTLHTNDAAGAIPRLLDLEARPDTLGPAINIIMAQRLIRKVKEENSEEVPLTDNDKMRLEKLFSDLDKKWWEELMQKGTKKVLKSDLEIESEGYSGRTGIFEGIVVNVEVEELIRREEGINELRKARAKQGIPSVAQQAALKILRGDTTFEEVERVVSLD